MSGRPLCGREEATVRAILADPASPLDPHVESCEACAQAARDVLAFDRSLQSAAAALVLEPLAPAYRLLGPRGAGSSRHEGPRRGMRRFVGPLRLAGTLAVVVVFAVVAVTGGPLRRGGIAGSNSATSPSPTTASAPAAQTGPAASPIPSHAGTGCEQAFGVWVKAWDASGMPDYRGGTPIRGAEHDAAAAAFAACSLPELEAANAALTVTHPRKPGSVVAPLLETVDKTIPVWCATDKLLLATRVCRDEASAGTTPAFHVIRPGDTLSAIAGMYGVSLAAILAENPQIENPDQILAGDVLILPQTVSAPTHSPPTPSASP